MGMAGEKQYRRMDFPGRPIFIQLAPVHPAAREGACLRLQDAPRPARPRQGSHRPPQVREALLPARPGRLHRAVPGPLRDRAAAGVHVFGL